MRSGCPTCGSPQPARHPAMQFEGEVQPCPDPFHACGDCAALQGRARAEHILADHPARWGDGDAGEAAVKADAALEEAVPAGSATDQALARLQRILTARGVLPTDSHVNSAVHDLLEATGAYVPAGQLDAGVPRRRSTDWPAQEMGWDRKINGGRAAARNEVGGMVINTLTDGKMVTLRVESGTPGKGVVRTYSRRLGQGQYAQEVVHLILEDVAEVEAAERELAPRGNHAMMVDPGGALHDPVEDGRR